MLLTTIIYWNIDVVAARNKNSKSVQIQRMMNAYSMVIVEEKVANHYISENKYQNALNVIIKAKQGN